MEYILLGLIILVLIWGIVSFIKNSIEDRKLQKQIEILKVLNIRKETNSSVAYYDNKAYLWDGEKIILTLDLNKK